MDIADLQDPLEVWKAIEGDRTELIALLRSGEKLTPRTRETLADWLEGKLEPVKLPKGRPSKKLSLDYVLSSAIAGAAYLGHDPTTPMGYAGYWYEVCRRQIRKRGLHIRKAQQRFEKSGHFAKFRRLAERRGRSELRSQMAGNWQDWLCSRIAERHGIDPDMFANYLARAKPKRHRRPWSGEEYIALRRQQIAYEIHRTKKGDEG